jgi:hypothetical protein
MRRGRRKPRALVFAVAAAFLFAGCGASGTDEVRYLGIEGDVAAYVSYQNGDSFPSEGKPVTEFLDSSGISGNPEEVWLISSGDGFCVKIAWDGAEKATLVYSKSKGWCVDAPEHPVSANAMDLDRIIVVSSDSDAGLRVVNENGSVVVVGFGKMLTGAMGYGFHFEGEGEVGMGAGQLTSVVYTREFSVSLADVHEGYRGGGFEIETESGDRFLTDGEGRFRIEKQKIDYIETTGDEYENVAEIRLR